MSALPKSTGPTDPTDARPANPKTGKLDIAATHKRVGKRFPKVLAELAK